MGLYGALRAEEVGAGYLPALALTAEAMEAWPQCCPLDQAMADGIDQHVEHLVDDVFVGEGVIEEKPALMLGKVEEIQTVPPHKQALNRVHLKLIAPAMRDFSVCFLPQKAAIRP